MRAWWLCMCSFFVVFSCFFFFFHMIRKWTAKESPVKLATTAGGYLAVLSLLNLLLVRGRARGENVVKKEKDKKKSNQFENLFQ